MSFLRISLQIKSLKFLLIAFMLSLSACSLLQSEPPDETRNWSAQKLYAEAREELKVGGYEKSIKYFEKLESRYPFGTYAQQAQMGQDGLSGQGDQAKPSPGAAEQDHLGQHQRAT